MQVPGALQSPRCLLPLLPLLVLRPTLLLGGRDALPASGADGALGLRRCLDSGGLLGTQHGPDLGDLLIHALALEFQAFECGLENGRV